MRKVKNYNKVKNNWVYGYLAIALVALGGCSSHSTKTHTSSTYSISASEARALGALSNMKALESIKPNNDSNASTMGSASIGISEDTSTYTIDFTDIDIDGKFNADFIKNTSDDLFFASFQTSDVNGEIKKLERIKIKYDKNGSQIVESWHTKEDFLDESKRLFLAKVYDLRAHSLNIASINTTYTITLSDNEKKVSYFQIGDVKTDPTCVLKQTDDTPDDSNGWDVNIVFESNCNVIIYAVDPESNDAYTYTAILDGVSQSFVVQNWDDFDENNDIKLFDMPPRPFYSEASGLKAGYFILNLYTGEFTLLNTNNQPFN